MAIYIPKPNELYDNILNDYAVALGVEKDDLDVSIQVQAKVDSGFQYGFLLMLSGLQNNIYPDLAQIDVLNRYGKEIIDRYIAPAVQGQYEVEITGTIGSVIPAQSLFIGNDDIGAARKQYVLDAEYTTVSDPDTITVRAVEAGVDSALIVGDELTAIQVLPIDDIATVTDEVVQATDEEDIEDYRDDVLAGLRLQPQGGSPSDWRLWALEVPELRQMYPYVDPDNAGDVLLYSEATEAATSTDPTENPEDVIGVPTQSTLDEVYKVDSGTETGVVVQDSVTLEARKPLTVMNVYSKPVEPLDVDITIVNLSDNSYLTAIEAALIALVYDIRPFVAGADDLSNRNDTITLGAVIAEVYNVLSGTTVTFDSISMDVDGATVNSYQFTFGYIPFINNVS